MTGRAVERRPTPLTEPWGQEELQQRVGAAVAAGRLPRSLLLYGPEGVGKRALALWTAGLLQCESEPGPCGACQSCRMAARLEHPDIHLHFPMPRPKRASSRAKLRDAIEKQRHERLARLREEPDAILDVDEPTGIYVAAVDNIRAQAARRPAMSRRAVFVVHDAEGMVPQSSSPEAANAFLKLLEEPPDFAYILLTSSRPSALLPTIRSRTVLLRVPPVSTDQVMRYLIDELGVPAEEARALARRGNGSVGQVRRLWERGPRESETAADRLLAAALSGRPHRRYRAAGEYSARGARAGLQPALEDLRARLRDMLCDVSDASNEVLDPAGIAALVGAPSLSGRGVLGALSAVDEALEGVSRNLNPQATVAVLLGEMSRALSEETA